MSQRWATGRVEAFSDGVFAIAITLLVLEIKIEPQPGLLADQDAPLPEQAQRRRGTLRGGLYGVALVLGVLVLPKLAAFGYFAVAAVAVLSARGEGRLTLKGPTAR